MALAAIERAVSQPQRLAEIVAGAADDGEAIAALHDAFDVTADEAGVLDQQFRALTRARVASLREALKAASEDNRDQRR